MGPFKIIEYGLNYYLAQDSWNIYQPKGVTKYEKEI